MTFVLSQRQSEVAMSVVTIHGHDAGAFAKSVLHHLLQQRDIAGGMLQGGQSCS